MHWEYLIAGRHGLSWWIARTGQPRPAVECKPQRHLAPQHQRPQGGGALQLHLSHHETIRKPTKANLNLDNVLPFASNLSNLASASPSFNQLNFARLFGWPHGEPHHPQSQPTLRWHPTPPPLLHVVRSNLGVRSKGFLEEFCYKLQSLSCFLLCFCQLWWLKMGGESTVHVVLFSAGPWRSTLFSNVFKTLTSSNLVASASRFGRTPITTVLAKGCKKMWKGLS